MRFSEFLLYGCWWEPVFAELVLFSYVGFGYQLVFLSVVPWVDEEEPSV